MWFYLNQSYALSKLGLRISYSQYAREFQSRLLKNEHQKAFKRICLILGSYVLGTN